MNTTWKMKAAKCKSILENSIPKKFKLSVAELPSEERRDVLNIPAESGKLSSRELQITESTATELVAQLAAGQWTAEEVTIAYLKRATIGQQLVNSYFYVYFRVKCLTQVNS